VYTIKSTHDNPSYQARGACQEFIYSREHETILSGPSETGKTLAACWKIHTLATKYHGSQIAIVRKVAADLQGTVLQTFDKVINPDVRIYGGERVEKYIYPNGSVIWTGGMDHPGKVLSGERDVIYVCQAEQLALDDWETLTIRTTGRAANMPYSQLIGDCNPGGSRHWIRTRGSLKLLRSKHTDNPTLYDEDGTLTERGKRTMEALKSLTGVRYQRLYLGEWATAEGAVYDQFGQHNVITRPETDFQSFGLACDEGYTNPAVILLVGRDSDGRLHILKEYYERGKLQSEVVLQAKAWTDLHGCNTAAVDAAAAGLIADMRNNGIPARPAKGRVLDGIHAVQDLLKIQDDGKPRLTVDPSCVNVINEFESYVWRPEKDEPIKENDHAMDAIRYYVDLTAHQWVMS